MNPIAVHDHLSPMGVFLDAAPSRPRIGPPSLRPDRKADPPDRRGPEASFPAQMIKAATMETSRQAMISFTAGAAWTGLSMSLGFANAPSPAPVSVLAHGYAEIMLLVVIGLMAGAVAVIANWAVESRIDRSVLKA